MPDIRLLQASVDAEDDSDLRILLHGKDIKYLTVEAGVYNADDLCFEPALISILPQLPDGSWISGTISRDDNNGDPLFTPSDTLLLPGVTHTWHNHFIEYLDLSIGKKLRSNVYEAVDSGLDRAVILKFARFAWEIPQIDAETQAYRQINESKTSPEFLGHVTENGRVIGFIMEQIRDAHHAGPQDLTRCQKVLSRLHRLGFLHGDVNRHNFLVSKDRVVLIDFDHSEPHADKDVLAAEMESLGSELRDTSGRGGRLVVECSTTG